MLRPETNTFEFYLEYHETLHRGGNDWAEHLIINGICLMGKTKKA